MALDETIREQAAAWAVRTGDAAFEDWEAFTLWLEQDSAHARAYDEVMASVIDATEALDLGEDRRGLPGGAVDDGVVVLAERAVEVAEDAAAGDDLVAALEALDHLLVLLRALLLRADEQEVEDQGNGEEEEQVEGPAAARLRRQ